MLGSINTGGFNKSQVDAMRDSNYFNRKGVAGVYDPINLRQISSQPAGGGSGIQDPNVVGKFPSNSVAV